MNVTDQLVEVMARAMAPEWFEVRPGERGADAMSRKIMCAQAHHAARRALTALRKAEEEVGWRCVPVELTPDMIYAIDAFDAGNLWRSGIEAAPKPPGGEV